MVWQGRGQRNQPNQPCITFNKRGGGKESRVMILGKRQEIERKKEISLFKKTKSFSMVENVLRKHCCSLAKGRHGKGQLQEVNAIHKKQTAKTCQDTCALPTCVWYILHHTTLVQEQNGAPGVREAWSLNTSKLSAGTSGHYRCHRSLLIVCELTL